MRNSSPQSGQIKKLSCCHWNVNSLVAQNLSKITQLEAGSFHDKCTKQGWTWPILDFDETFPNKRYI